MIFYLILLLVLVPVAELVILLQVHHAIANEWGTSTGLLVTIGTIVLTGIAGASLARHQGLTVFRKIQESTGLGELPGPALLDGVLILIGAAMLLTPGFLTDIAGFTLLMPWTRTGYRNLLVRWFRKKMQQGKAHFTVVSPTEVSPETSPNDTFEVDAEVIDTAAIDPEKLPE